VLQIVHQSIFATFLLYVAIAFIIFVIAVLIPKKPKDAIDIAKAAI
jgi:hypothetical protein